MTVRDLFLHPVLADLARAVKGAGESDQPAMLAAERDEPLPLSFAQQRLWFLAQMGVVSEAYHIKLGSAAERESWTRPRCGKRWTGSWSGTRRCGRCL